MINKEALTPMMRQYLDIKENTKDALVFYRLGDFYELFMEDAKTASKVLDLVLTARSAGNNQKVPMAGVPHHAAKSYIQKLINHGYKVAIVEQTEDPKEAKGLVKREVVEIITPGTYIEHEEIETKEIAAIHSDLVYATLVFGDIVAGTLRALRIMNDDLEILKTLEQFEVSELVVDATFSIDLKERIQETTNIHVSYVETFNETLNHKDAGVQQALRKLFGYLEYTQKRSLDHFGDVVVLNDLSYLKMDYASITNLELIKNDQNKDLSLYSFLNRTATTMGARKLKDDLLQPMVNLDDIIKTQNQIEVFIQNFIMADTLKDILKETYDIHRVVARVSTDKNNAQDFVRLKQTLLKFKEIQSHLKAQDNFSFINALDPLIEVYEALEKAIYDDAPVQFKDGRTFKKGINTELDELLILTKDGKQWLLNYEEKQREITGIKNLRVGYTRAFGYYIEITKGQVENVQDSFGYVRRQTLTNAERYISEELQSYETKVLEAGERILEIEQALLKKYTEYIMLYVHQIHKIGDAIAKLDVLLSLSEVSSLSGYVKPIFNHDHKLDLKEGRHAVLESELKSHQYISSDCEMDKNSRLLILTGPNMGGKSTYMRMVAINVIMAQMGCYVPATYANLPLVDQIFTRMGASDDIMMGQSTFMIEMVEAQRAIALATKNSLVLFDEIGRGTSTYDGMALAQSILEYMLHTVGCNTIFSTHYHELTSLETMHPGIKNIHVEVHEEDDHVTFLYRVIEGRANKSYGINVARLAHLPKSVIDRANQNLMILEAQKDNLNIDMESIVIEVEPQGYTLIKERLDKVDINQMTPLEALLVLGDIKRKLGDIDE